MLYYLPLKKVGEDYMERYAEVKSRKELKEQFDGAKQIGTGFEGKAYLTKDNKVLKIISTKAPLIPEEQADCIIMKQDAESKSVFFPDKLFICNGVVIGYTCDYFGKTVAPFNMMNIPIKKLLTYDYSQNRFDRINFNKIFNAREVLFRDILLLTEHGIYLEDVAGNILFDGQRFGLIDTLHYGVKDNASLVENIQIIDTSMLEALEEFNPLFTADYKQSFENNVARIRKQFKIY